MLLNLLVIWGIFFLSAGAIIFMAFYPSIRSNKAKKTKKTDIKSVSVFILVTIALLLFSLCLVAPILFF
jgi:uncharacterized protein with PQ loop repeat